MLGGPKPGCFKPGNLQFLRGSALLRSSATFCALLRSFADLRLRSFARICALLRSFACSCVRPHLERPRLGTAECEEILPNFRVNFLARCASKPYFSVRRFPMEPFLVALQGPIIPNCGIVRESLNGGSQMGA